MLCLSGIGGDLLVCSWLFPRAARWILDRNQIHGQEGPSLLKSLGESSEQEEETADNPQEDAQEDETRDASAEKPRVIDGRSLPARKIYCLDLRAYPAADVYLEEIERIAHEQQTTTVELTSWIQGDPSAASLDRYEANDPGLDHNAGGQPGGPIVVSEDPSRRWYPVIDFSRCTNCLECIDFCLFGVYGIDGQETILVEQPDNCRQGCPACSRVCPENAIIFPQHKAPTIAGSPEVGGNLKIDLSQLFGAPDPGEPGAATAAQVAARERDEQLLLAGRTAVGMEVGLRQRHAETPTPPKDDLDRLIDALDALDL
jgi:NAD-dependent dihydropyrimidine dehydrogenase PreA subunit